MAYLKRSAATVTTRTEDDLVLDTPALGTPSAGVVTNLSGVLPAGVTGGSGLTALGTVATGNLSNTDLVFPDGHICKISYAHHESTHNSSYHGLDYNEDMTTTNTNNTFDLAHTALTASPKFHGFLACPIGASVYGGATTIHLGLFGDDVFLTSTREYLTGAYGTMHQVTLAASVASSTSAGSDYTFSVRFAMSGIFSTAGSMNGKIFGVGHSGFDSPQNHAAHLICMEEIA